MRYETTLVLENTKYHIATSKLSMLKTPVLMCSRCIQHMIKHQKQKGKGKYQKPYCTNQIQRNYQKLYCTNQMQRNYQKLCSRSLSLSFALSQYLTVVLPHVGGELWFQGGEICTLAQNGNRVSWKPIFIFRNSSNPNCKGRCSERRGICQVTVRARPIWVFGLSTPEKVEAGPISPHCAISEWLPRIEGFV